MPLSRLRQDLFPLEAVRPQPGSPLRLGVLARQAGVHLQSQESVPESRQELALSGSLSGFP